MVSVKCLRRFAAGLAFAAMAIVLASPAATPAGQANPRLQEIIKKAAQEGELTYQGPDPATGLPTDQMLREMEALVEKHFGVKLRVKIDNALSFPASTAKALTEIKAGAPPTFDLMMQTPVSGAPLLKENLIEPIPWLELFPHIKSGDLELKGRAVTIYTMFMLPEYNTQFVKQEDVPRSWDDFLDPKWKGKLGVLVYPDPWAFLAQPDAWGEERTFSYLKKLMQQNPKLGRFPEAHERVVSGETPLAWGGHRERTLFHKERGAPVDVASDVMPSLLWIYNVFVPRGARHPNAAALVAAALLTEEGQEQQVRYQNASSLFRPNTPAARFASGRKLLRPDVDFQLSEGARLYKQIRPIMVGKR